MEKIKVIAFENCKELVNKIEKILQKKFNTKESLTTNVLCSRFDNGEGQLYISEDIRNKDLYILSDVGNYDISYDFYGQRHQVVQC